MRTTPGITLSELGSTSTRPTVPTAVGAWASAIACTSTASRAQATNASARRGIGVVPAWLSRPVMVDLVPAHALHAGDDADGLVLRLQDRPLLDVQLEVGRQRHRPGLHLAAPADAVERLAEAHAVDIGDRVGLGPAVHAGEHARAQHGRGEAGALLVGPVHHHDSRVGLVAGRHQRAQRLQRAEHAQVAVELAPRRLRVEVAAERDGGELRVPARHAGRTCCRPRPPSRGSPAPRSRA